MNKKQLIVAWGMGILLSVLIFNWLSPINPSLEEILSYKPFHYRNIAEFLKFTLPILIIGSLLIYTLRSKKK